MGEALAAIGIGTELAADAGTAAAVGEAGAIGATAGVAEGAGTAVGAGLSSAAAAGLPASVAAGDIGLSAAGTLGIGEGFAGGTAAGLGAGAAAGAGESGGLGTGILGSGLSTGSDVADAAAQGVGINLGEDAVTGQTPTPQGVLEAAGTGAAGGALTGGLSGAPTTTPSSGAGSLTGGPGLGAAATTAPASITAGGGDAGLGVGGGDVTAGVPPASGAVTPDATGAPTSTGAPTAAPGGGGGGDLPTTTGGPENPAAESAVNITTPAASEVNPIIGQGNLEAAGLDNSGMQVPAGTTAAPTSTPANGPSAVMQAFNNPTWDNIGTALEKNALTIGGLGLNAANFLNQPNAAQQATTAQNNQTAIAGQQQTLAAQDLAQSQQLESYQNTGTLPPGVQAQLDTQRKAADAALASNMASIGNSGSSAEIQDKAAHQQAEAATAANIQTSLMAQGIQLAQMAGGAYGAAAQTYGTLYNQSVATDNALQQSIAAFSAALAGAGGTTPGSFKITPTGTA